MAIPRVSLECSQLLGRFYTSLSPTSSETQAWQLKWFREKRFRLFLPPCVCEDGLPLVRERVRKESYSVVHTEHYYYTTLYSNVFFVCLAEKSYTLFCRKTVAGLNKELQNKTLLHLAETDRLRHTEHQLHASESKVERLNSENIKLRLKIDDLRIKLQNRKLSIF